VVKTLGDGMVCQFAAPDAAFHTACDMQAAAVELAPRAPGKLAISVGFTYGPVVFEGTDVFGDTVNVCARLVAVANPDQVLTTEPTVEALSNELRPRCRTLYPMKMKGRAEKVAVYDVMWRSGTDADLTETSMVAPETALQPGPWVLKLTYSGDTFTVEPKGVLRIGRDPANDVIVKSARASRVHARVYGREGNFVIADQSSNGTFLLIDGNANEVKLRREEAVLGERGWIGLGNSAAKHGDHVLRYRRQKRRKGG
jgi:adenylate cyclase